MTDVGIRELKARTSEILRTVREQGVRYVITHHGRPIATLSPLEIPDSEPGASQDRLKDSWRQLEQLGDEIGRAWKSEQSSTEILAGMRR